MTDAHTPGPWVADEYPHGDCWQIKYGTHGNWLAEVMIDGDHKGAAADARLIAAAPDMLEACRTALAYCEHLKTSSFAVEPSHAAELRAAILKATTPNAGERE